MNLLFRLPLFLALLALGGITRLPAQDATTPASETAPPGSTVITSDELRSDENTHISVFTGDVTVTGNAFNLTCDEMTVYFTKANKIDHIVCVGNIVIKQPGRVTTCGRCEYFSEEDKFVLTDGPVILDGKNRVSGPRITIYRGTQQMNVQGKGSKVTLGEGALAAPKTSAAPRATP